jgi:hypothetical protein
MPRSPPWPRPAPPVRPAVPPRGVAHGARPQILAAFLRASAAAASLAAVVVHRGAVAAVRERVGVDAARDRRALRGVDSAVARPSHPHGDRRRLQCLFVDNVCCGRRRGRGGCAPSRDGLPPAGAPGGRADAFLRRSRA